MMMDLDMRQDQTDTAIMIEGDIVKYKVSDMFDKERVQHLMDIGCQTVDENIATLVLIDINKVEKFSLEDRGSWIQFLKDPHIKKTAVFGGDQFVRTVASFIIKASGSANIRLFATEEEALNWLHS